MKKIIGKIKEAIEWLVFAQWYKGGDMGDGILVSMISGVIFIYGGIVLVIYWAYTLLASLF